MAANFAFADLHGNLNAWHAIQERTNMDDRLYCLGDSADRGPDGYQMLREILADPRVVYLKGNHDDMFVEGILGDDPQVFSHWTSRCGGWPTYEAWNKDGSPHDILEQLRQAPIREKLVTKMGLILLSHAGYTPWKGVSTIPSDFDFLWDRDHISDPWVLGDKDIFVVHGHTPVFNPPSFGRLAFGIEDVEPLFYCDGHKVCIDMGTPASYACALLNLDDFSFEVIRV